MVINWLLMITELGRQAAVQCSHGQGHGAERLQTPDTGGEMFEWEDGGREWWRCGSRALQRVTCAAAGLHKPARCHQAQ